MQPESQVKLPKLGWPNQKVPVGKRVKVASMYSSTCWREWQDQSTMSMGTGWTNSHQHWHCINTGIASALASHQHWHRISTGITSMAQVGTYSTMQYAKRLITGSCNIMYILNHFLFSFYRLKRNHIIVENMHLFSSEVWLQTLAVFKSFWSWRAKKFYCSISY